MDVALDPATGEAKGLRPLNRASDLMRPWALMPLLGPHHGVLAGPSNDFGCTPVASRIERAARSSAAWRQRARGYREARNLAQCLVADVAMRLDPT